MGELILYIHFCAFFITPYMIYYDDTLKSDSYLKEVLCCCRNLGLEMLCASFSLPSMISCYVFPEKHSPALLSYNSRPNVRLYHFSEVILNSTTSSQHVPTVHLKSRTRTRGLSLSDHFKSPLRRSYFLFYYHLRLCITYRYKKYSSS